MWRSERAISKNEGGRPPASGLWSGFCLRWMLLVALLLRPIGVAAADDLVLAGASGHLVMNPATLELRFEPIGRKQVQLSAARSAPLRVANLTHADTTAEWSLPEANVRVVLRLEQDAVSVRF